MQFIPKLSGTKVCGFNIDPIFDSLYVSLSEALKVLQKQESMDYLLDNYYFNKSDDDWIATVRYDDVMKLSVLENYPEYEKEFKEYFGDGCNWINHYIRFDY